MLIVSVPRLQALFSAHDGSSPTTGATRPGSCGRCSPPGSRSWPGAGLFASLLPARAAGVAPGAAGGCPAGRGPGHRPLGPGAGPDQALGAALGADAGAGLWLAESTACPRRACRPGRCAGRGGRRADERRPRLHRGGALLQRGRPVRPRAGGQLIAKADVCVLAVDDGSTDAGAGWPTWPPAIPTVAVLPLGRNHGKAGGAAWATGGGGRRGRAGHLLRRRLRRPAAEVARLIDTLRADVGLGAVIASRVAMLGTGIRRSAVRHCGRLFATLSSLVLGVPVYDTQCGAKAFQAGRGWRRRCPAFVSQWAFDVRARPAAARPVRRDAAAVLARRSGNAHDRAGLRATADLWRIGDLRRAG